MLQEYPGGHWKSWLHVAGEGEGTVPSGHSDKLFRYHSAVCIIHQIQWMVILISMNLRNVMQFSHKQVGWQPTEVKYNMYVSKYQMQSNIRGGGVTGDGQQRPVWIGQKKFGGHWVSVVH